MYNKKNYSNYIKNSNDENIKNSINISDNDNEYNFLLQKKNTNGFLEEEFDETYKLKNNIENICGISNSKSMWYVNKNNNNNITNYEEEYDKYGKNFNLLLNNGYNILNKKDENYFDRQFKEVIPSKNEKNNQVNKHSSFYNNFKDDPFSISSFYKL